uniref:Uncharacterized protein n=1 Tax=Aegilops tauschii subsp. strangulata TaxID=200361 RepID=A0A453D6E5_AEGTS
MLTSSSGRTRAASCFLQDKCSIPLATLVLLVLSFLLEIHKIDSFCDLVYVIRIIHEQSFALLHHNLFALLVAHANFQICVQA